MDGILNINKPSGMTSFDVVARVRRLAQTKKVGHAGTLDPDASGVLPVCVGRATKIIEFLMDKDKTYRVGLLLGTSTDTQDSSGRILYEKPVTSTEKDIERVIKGFVGKQEQIPPMYSAIRVNGQRLYKLAREGIEIDRKPRIVTFHRIDIISIEREQEKVRILLDVECSKGTYIRTLCHDIGERLNCGGHMFSLIRTVAGPFSIDESYTLEELEDLKSQNRLSSAIIDIDKALLQFPAIEISKSNAKKLRNGMFLPANSLALGYYRVYYEGNFLAIGTVFEKGNNKFLKSYKWIKLEMDL